MPLGLPPRGFFHFLLRPTHGLPTTTFCIMSSGFVVSKAVGYQNKDLPMQGYNFACPSFVDVGSSKTVDLQNIKLVGAIGDMTEAIFVYDENAIFQGEC